MRIPNWLRISFLPFIMSGCGGSDGQSSQAPTPVILPSPTPTTSPTPFPTVTPSPTPTPDLYPDDQTILTLPQVTELTGYKGSNGFIRDSSGKITYTTNYGFGPGTPAIYAPSAGFTYRPSSFTVTGMPDIGSVDLRPVSGQTDAGFTIYSGQSNGVLVDVREFNISPSNPVLPLSYTSLAYLAATYRDPSTGETLYGISPISFGLIFDPAVYTPTGIATYHGVVIGHARAEGGADAYLISGDIHIEIDYDTGALSGYFEISGRSDVTDETFDFGRIAIRDTTLNYLGYINAAPDLPEGKLQGNFTGAHAQEMMGAIDAALTDPKAPSLTLKATAAFVARK